MIDVIAYIGSFISVISAILSIVVSFSVKKQFNKIKAISNFQDSDYNIINSKYIYKIVSNNQVSFERIINFVPQKDITKITGKFYYTAGKADIKLQSDYLTYNETANINDTVYYELISSKLLEHGRAYQYSIVSNVYTQNLFDLSPIITSTIARPTKQLTLTATLPVYDIRTNSVIAYRQNGEIKEKIISVKSFSETKKESTYQIVFDNPTPGCIYGLNWEWNI